MGSDLTISPTINSPQSGCNLSNSETVKITIINAEAAPYSGTFTVSYSTGGTVVSENVNVPLLPTSATYIYEFNDNVDLSACGLHEIKIYVSDINDGNQGNDTLTVSITNDCSVSPGTVSAATMVCHNLNSGTIDIIGNTGNIESWESSIDNGVNWTNLSNTSTSQNYLNLTIQTDYRIIYSTAFGICPNDTLFHSINVDVISEAGILSSDSVHCDTIFPTVLNLNNSTGDILNWYYSINGTSFTNWTNITNTLTYTELAQNFYFFAVVQNGTCPIDSSNVVNISITQGSDAGIINGPDSICLGENDVPFNLINSNGSTIDWSISDDNGLSFSNFQNDITSVDIDNLLSNSILRVIVKENACENDTALFNLTVTPTSFAGSLTGNATYCSNTNDSIIVLDNYLGENISWLYSDDNGQTYLNHSNTNDTLFYSNITTSTEYLALVQYLDCPIDSSNAINITILNSIMAGEIIGLDSICISNDSLKYELTNNNSNNINWEYSIDAGLSWINSNYNATLFYLNSPSYNTIIRAIANEPNCPADTAVHLLTVLETLEPNFTFDSLIIGDSLQLNSEIAANYFWYPNTNISSTDIQSPCVFPMETTTYKVDIENIYGCTATSTFFVFIVENPSTIKINNLVSPNGDGINDTWTINNIENYPTNNVTVFDPYGQIIFSQDNYNNDWNLNSSEIPDGTYYYVVNIDNGNQVFKGVFTVIDSK